MAIVKNSVMRVACAGAFAAAIIIAPVVGIISTEPSADSRTVADPCTQVNTNGSVSLQCGSAPPSVGGSSGGCITPYGTYQNCMIQRGPRRLVRGPARSYRQRASAVLHLARTEAIARQMG